MKTDYGLSDPGDCKGRENIYINLCGDEISLVEGTSRTTLSLDDFLVEIEDRCQDSLHNIFDETKRKQNNVFERLAEITRPDPISGYMRDLIEDNSRNTIWQVKNYRTWLK